MTAIGPKEPRIRDPKYLAWLRTRPCCICGAVDKIDACHIRSGSIAYAKRETGMAEKPDDKWAVSMCRSDHTKQHAMNELEFYRQNGIDPFQLARKYYASATLEGHSSPTARKPGRPKKLGKRIASRPFGPQRGLNSIKVDEAYRAIWSILADLTEGERFEAMSEIATKYCTHCWSKQPLHGICQCWNDE